MNFHKTPRHIVKLIKRHVPKNAMRVLEPAVGEGALLEALSPYHFNEYLTLVDVDMKRLKALEASYENLSFVNEDFLEWARNVDYQGKYDLVVTNPPFSARSKEWVWHNDSKVPIEIAFVRSSVDLLREKGTLIAIVPDSLVNSYRFLDQRKWLVSQGEVRYVYQLPRKSFSGIEGAFFLLVFKKTSATTAVGLRSFGAEGLSEIKLGGGFLKEQDFRFDYNYYYEKLRYDSATKLFGGLASVPLKSFCNIRRGPIRSDYNGSGVFHSSSYRSGYWESYGSSSQSNAGLCVAVKRVSRNAHLSFGLFYKKDISKCTDCVIIIEADGVCAMKLLFFLRVMFSNQSGGGLLLKGVGAKFIPIEKIKEIEYLDISNIFDREFGVYLSAYKSMKADLIKKIESVVYFKIHNSGLISSIQLRMVESELEGFSLDGVADASASGG